MKRIILILSLALAMALCACACADTDLTALYDAGAALVFDTPSVAVRVNAEFALNGERFKTAELTQVQSGANYYRDVHLLTPMPGGETLDSGYTILSAGGQVASVRSNMRGVTYSWQDPEPRGLLWHTVGLDNLVRLGRGVAEMAGAILPAEAVTVADDTVVIHLDRDTMMIPDAVDSVMSLVLQAWGEKVKYSSYMIMPAQGGA